MRKDWFVLRHFCLALLFVCTSACLEQKKVENAADAAANSLTRDTASVNQPPPTYPVRVSWNVNREGAVNSLGGGYRVYYSNISGFTLVNAAYVDVPYVSGPLTPTNIIINFNSVGTYYVKVVAYTSFTANGPGLNMSLPSGEAAIAVP